MRIPSSKYAAMQHLLMLVSHGYRYWFRGEVKYDKAIALSDKLHALYPLNASHDSRAWARKTKRYAAHLLMYPYDKDKTKIQFWLLATAGEPMPGFEKIHERERLSDGNESGLSWADQYLIERRKDQEHLTWTMRNDYYKRLKAEMDQAAIEGERAVKKLWDNLIHMPMYNGIRAQLRELDSYSRHVWQKRHRKAPYPLPDLFLPFAGRVKVFEDMTLEHLVAAIRKQQENSEAAGLEQARKLLDSSDADRPAATDVKRVKPLKYIYIHADEFDPTCDYDEMGVCPIPYPVDKESTDECNMPPVDFDPVADFDPTADKLHNSCQNELCYKLGEFDPTCEKYECPIPPPNHQQIKSVQ